MAADRSITCANQDGDTIEFTEYKLSPFLLVKVEGVYDNKNNINMMENINTDGGIFQGSNASYRNIVITLKDVAKTKTAFIDADVYISSAVIKGKTLEILDASTPELSIGGKDFSDHRELLDKVFKRNELGRLVFKESEEERAIDYYVESITSTGTHSVRYHTISLICPDPFFYELNDTETSLIELRSNLEFIHEFPEEGEEFGYYSVGQKDIYNESANENIGITINISGDGNITNPSITRLENGDFIKIGNSQHPFTLDAGDNLIITTGVGNKHVYLLHNGVTTEINYYMVDGSSFVQLMRGHNTIYFDSDTGKDTANIVISYRLQYMRA